MPSSMLYVYIPETSMERTMLRVAFYLILVFATLRIGYLTFNPATRLDGIGDSGWVWLIALIGIAITAGGSAPAGPPAAVRATERRGVDL
jgi:hypothetical protein